MFLHINAGNGGFHLTLAACKTGTQPLRGGHVHVRLPINVTGCVCCSPRTWRPPEPESFGSLLEASFLLPSCCWGGGRGYSQSRGEAVLV